MNILVILLSMVGGAAISELYHRRMWVRYQQGKREGRQYNVRDAKFPKDDRRYSRAEERKEEEQ